jgi:hypothetical protein
VCFFFFFFFKFKSPTLFLKTKIPPPDISSGSGVGFSAQALVLFILVVTVLSSSGLCALCAAKQVIVCPRTGAVGQWGPALRGYGRLLRFELRRNWVIALCRVILVVVLSYLTSMHLTTSGPGSELIGWLITLVVDPLGIAAWDMGLLAVPLGARPLHRSLPPWATHPNMWRLMFSMCFVSSVATYISMRFNTLICRPDSTGPAPHIEQSAILAASAASSTSLLYIFKWTRLYLQKLRAPRFPCVSLSLHPTPQRFTYPPHWVGGE